MTSDVGLTEEDQKVELGRRRLEAWNKLVSSLEALEAELGRTGGKPIMTSVETPEGDWVSRPLSWDACCGAYKALRALFVKRRSRGKAKVQDPSLERWVMEVDDFRTFFWGDEEADGKRRFRGVKPEVASTMKRYSCLQRKLHKATPEYKEAHRKYMQKWIAAKRKREKEAVHA